MKHHWRYEKILTLKQAEEKSVELKAAGKTIVTNNGSFDILHAGHLDLLEEAKQQGDILFIGLNSDSSIQNEKGTSRPFITAEQRAAMLAALACVDFVVIIDAPYSQVQDILIKTVKPHVHVNGLDYGPPETWIEWPVMLEVGSRAHGVERRPNLATTDLVKKIKAST